MLDEDSDGAIDRDEFRKGLRRRGCTSGWCMVLRQDPRDVCRVHGHAISNPAEAASGRPSNHAQHEQVAGQEESVSRNLLQGRWTKDMG